MPNYSITTYLESEHLLLGDPAPNEKVLAKCLSRSHPKQYLLSLR